MSQSEYVPSPGVFPEDASPPWTVVADDGSLIEIATLLGAPALHVQDPLLPSIDSICPVLPAAGADGDTTGYGGVLYTLAEPTLSDANVYGIEVGLLMLDECAPRKVVPDSALFGVADGERVAMVVAGNPDDPVATFHVSPPPKPKGEDGGAIEPAVVHLAPGMFHVLSVRVERGRRAELFVDGGTAPAVTVDYAALPTAVEIADRLPLPPGPGGFAFGSDLMEVGWSKVSVLSCSDEPIDIAKSGLAETAAEVTLKLPPAPATTLNKKLIGNGSATFQLDKAADFQDAGNVCAAVGKHDAGAGKVVDAKVQLDGWPTCPAGGSNCITADAKEDVRMSLQTDMRLIEESKISACTLSPTCAGCPPAPTVTRIEREDLGLRDGVVCPAQRWINGVLERMRVAAGRTGEALQATAAEIRGLICSGRAADVVLTVTVMTGDGIARRRTLGTYADFGTTSGVPCP